MVNHSAGWVNFYVISLIVFSRWHFIYNGSKLQKDNYVTFLLVSGYLLVGLFVICVIDAIVIIKGTQDEIDGM